MRVEELRIAKAKVAGSNPVFRSNHGPEVPRELPRLRAFVFLAVAAAVPWQWFGARISIGAFGVADMPFPDSFDSAARRSSRSRCV